MLLYFSAHLSDSQQKWHPYRQEFYALLCYSREAVKHFGWIPKIIHTDHARIVRQVDLPLGRIDPMEYRWMVELTQGGSPLNCAGSEEGLDTVPSKDKGYLAGAGRGGRRGEGASRERR